jgi:hypothetical protein
MRRIAMHPARGTEDDAMTPMMSLFLRCLLALALVVVLLSLSTFATAATPAWIPSPSFS